MGVFLKIEDVEDEKSFYWLRALTRGFAFIGMHGNSHAQFALQNCILFA
ncbi:hypothetical protein N646_3535 [Vibrio alginolyticus NBRC 15630 = ATCC 17749]|uniref:Uncharacterized protein n=1 Tax=Vibrio alginolyticus (strain ATCC 17749 / DSM 2171 / NBRC 15630 / NCIMB 1903 / NCTC 12160 / XII-53) TaxID=1219076 RepID=A0A2I3CNJ0_VIBAX|nr:hypothetical protein N646_3535 [Vibrio alginolyticus NBRC 15630 = ATCC 17749]